MRRPHRREPTTAKRKRRIRKKEPLTATAARRATFALGSTGAGGRPDRARSEVSTQGRTQKATRSAGGGFVLWPPPGRNGPEGVDVVDVGAPRCGLTPVRDRRVGIRVEPKAAADSRRRPGPRWSRTTTVLLTGYLVGRIDLPRQEATGPRGRSVGPGGGFSPVTRTTCPTNRRPEREAGAFGPRPERD